MSILDIIDDNNKWFEFYQYKIDKGHLTKKEKKELSDFIENKKYVSIANAIKKGTYVFSIPTKKLVNKMGSEKKRVVYCYPKEENIILKFITFHLFEYDAKMIDNCFSFRKNYGVKKAIDSIVYHKNIENMYCYKVDIKNYFNSINVEKLLVILDDIIDDKNLYNLMKNLLNINKSYFEGEIIEENRGAMAGVPFSPFLANVYLRDLDKYFYDHSILYARYSDDIIVFADTKEELDSYIHFIHNFLNEYGLMINKDKEYTFIPHQPWNFLGIKYCDRVIDLSDITLDKIKGKIKRKAKAIYRWKLRKKVESEKAIKTMIKCFNYKFFEAKDSTDLTWSRWFFPLINTDKGLNEVDLYLQQYLRYLSTGKHIKSNYNVRYKTLKECNYKSLVNEYYKTKKS